MVKFAAERKLLYIGGGGPKRLCGSFREARGARYGMAAAVEVTYWDNLSQCIGITLSRTPAQ